MAALVKSMSHVPIQELIFLRCMLATPFFAAYLIYQNRPLVVKAGKIILLRSLFGFSAMIGFYYSLTHMGLADCIFIGKIQPLFIALLAPLVLGEKTPKAAWLAIATGLGGVALIMKPALDQWPLAAWAALAAAFAGACAHMMIRRLNSTDDPATIVFNFLFLTGLAGSIWCLLGWTPVARQQWPAIAGISFFASLGQILVTMAYRRDRAPAVAAASYASIILSVVYGYIFWGENPQLLVWLGGGLIVCGGLLLVKTRLKISEPASR
jgi:drug/metabolite transporter (DMT)-like permease